MNTNDTNEAYLGYLRHRMVATHDEIMAVPEDDPEVYLRRNRIHERGWNLYREYLDAGGSPGDAGVPVSLKHRGSPLGSIG